MLTLEDAAKLTTEERLARLAAGPDAVHRAIAGHDEATLARRPDGKSWAPTEVVCHLRDTEAGFMSRFQAILAADEPPLEGPDPDRWAEERQYLRDDPARALAAFRARRQDCLDLLRALEPGQWQRAGVHPRRGRMTVADFTALMVYHDENHLEQVRRGLRGEP
jgi:hypothetical protein